MIVDELVEKALSMVGKRKVEDVRAGVGYTCVMLEDDACGLAYTFRNEMGNGCGVLGQAGSLIGKTGSEIIPWAKDSNRLKAAIGLATINAVLNNSMEEWDNGNVMEAIKVEAEDTFGMVGEFTPILRKVKNETKNIYVFEQNVPEGSKLYSKETIPLYLPKCNVVLITATSIINHTIDEVISYCGSAKMLCLVGLSTPLCPEVFSKYNVTLLAGSVVKDPQQVLKIVSQGGGTMAMKPFIDQVLVKV